MRDCVEKQVRCIPPGGGSTMTQSHALQRSIRVAAWSAAAFCISSMLRAQTGMIPLNDLGSGLYLNQYQGGLYPNGSNTVPAAHASEGMLRAGAIQPLDLNGNPSASGHYVLLSIGMSNTTQEFCSQSGAIPPNPWTFMG